MTDKELDMLFEQSAQNRQAVAQINCQVMRTVRRDMRRKALLKWAKLLALCFGLPIAVVAYIYLLVACMPEMSVQLTVITYVLPLGTIALLLGKGLHDFSPSEL